MLCIDHLMNAYTLWDRRESTVYIAFALHAVNTGLVPDIPYYPLSLPVVIFLNTELGVTSEASCWCCPNTK